MQLDNSPSRTAKEARLDYISNNRNSDNYNDKETAEVDIDRDDTKENNKSDKKRDRQINIKADREYTLVRNQVL